MKTVEPRKIFEPSARTTILDPPAQKINEPPARKATLEPAAKKTVEMSSLDFNVEDEGEVYKNANSSQPTIRVV